MNTQTTHAGTIDWNHVLRVILRATWWLLNALFKVALVLGTAVVKLFVALFLSDSDNKEIETPNDEDEYIPLNSFERNYPVNKNAPF